jgi:hypothetical protein
VQNVPPLVQAHITVDQNFPEGQPRRIIVQGRPDACQRASTMIRELINGEPGSAQAIIQRVMGEVRRTWPRGDCATSGVLASGHRTGCSLAGVSALLPRISEQARWE